MPIEIEPFATLFFIFRPGCGACEAALPELDKFMVANPNLMVTKLNADGPFVERMTGMRRVDATPTYVFRVGNEGRARAGLLKAKEIERWLSALMEEAGDDE